MNSEHQHPPLWRDQTNKSLNKYRSESIEQRAKRIGKELMIPQVGRKKDKNTFAITSNASTHLSQKSVDTKPEEDLQRRVRMLDYELKRKLNEDSLLKNLFKTKQIHQLSHIDLYIQIRRLEDQQRELIRKQQESQEAARQAQAALKAQEEEHFQNMEDLTACLCEKQRQWTHEKESLRADVDKYKMLSEDRKLLIQQLQKKNNELSKQQKQIVQDCSIEHNAQNLAFIQLKEQSQTQIDKLNIQLTSLTQELKEAKRILSQQEEMIQENVQLKKRKEQLQKQFNLLEYQVFEFQGKEEEIRREEKQKYSAYYDKLRGDYEIQIQNMQSRHEEAITTLQQQINSKEQSENSYKKHIQQLERRIEELGIIIENNESKSHALERDLNSVKGQLERQIQANSRLLRQVKEAKLQRQEVEDKAKKINFQVNDAKQLQAKLQAKLKALNEQNELLITKNEELKAAADHVQSYRKLNDKIYSQNYKTLGRLIETSYQVQEHLNIQLGGLQPNVQPLVYKTINEESLDQVVSHLKELLNQLFRTGQTLLKQKEALSRERSIENREVVAILEQCRNFLKHQDTELVIERYILLLKQRNPSPQSHSERIQLYHELLENLINLHGRHYSSDNGNRPRFMRDSLDSTSMFKQFQSKQKEPKGMQRDYSCQVIRRARFETQPHDLPLRRRLLPQDEKEEKQNASSLANRPTVEKNQRPNSKYINDVRQRISKNASKRKQMQTQKRSEVQKKYFRS